MSKKARNIKAQMRAQQAKEEVLALMRMKQDNCWPESRTYAEMDAEISQWQRMSLASFVARQAMDGRGV